MGSFSKFMEGEPNQEISPNFEVGGIFERKM
jgi:hypothetical protein